MMRAIALISKEALQHNLKKVYKFAPNSKVIAMVKGDSYGHHNELVVKNLNNCDMFAVTQITEAYEVRKYTAKPILLILSDVFKDINYIDNVEFVVHCEQQLRNILNIKKHIKIWLKIDTGMSRLGFSPERLEYWLNKLSKNPNIEIKAIMSHFACADDIGNAFNKRQLSIFNKYTPSKLKKSIANSAAIITIPESHFDFVRPGIMLYGISPFGINNKSIDIDLKPVMKLMAPIICVKKIKKGHSVGYGQTWVSDKNTTIALIAIGYRDGYPRHARIGTPVLINNKRHSLIGRVSMDIICVDIANTKVNIGDMATLWGDEKLTAEEVAYCSETIGYELTSNISNRVKFVLDN